MILFKVVLIPLQEGNERNKKDIWTWRKKVIHSLYIRFLLISDSAFLGLLYVLPFICILDIQKLLPSSISVKVSKASLCNSKFSSKTKKELFSIQAITQCKHSWLGSSCTVILDPGSSHTQSCCLLF